MKKIFLIVAFLFSAFVSFSQVIPKPNPTAVGIGYKRLLADSTIFIPTGGAIPRLGANNINRRSAIYADTINKKLYVFYPNDSTWKESGTDTASLSARIDARVKYADTSSMLAPYLRTANSHGVPSGGTSGQLLSKNSDSDYDLVWIDNYADWTSLIKQQYKATESITKGQAVYISGADGTNALISKASNASEITSSKTIGLLAQTLSTNGKGFVVTEGLLGGLNTATAIAGDPVWLGVNGDLIFGYLNKPHAPAHLVYLGVVTRANGSNGEILIKPQNGFEVKELHDVSAQSPSNNDGLFYNNSNSLWETKSIATALGYTPANAANFVPYTGATSGVNLGLQNLTANKIIVNGNGTNMGANLAFKQYPSTVLGETSKTTIGAIDTTKIAFSLYQGLDVFSIPRYKQFAFSTDSIPVAPGSPSIASNTYYLPNTSGKLALTSDVATGYVPYTGATTDVDLGNHNLSTNYVLTAKNQVSAGSVYIDGRPTYNEGDMLAFAQYPSTMGGTYKKTAFSVSGNNILHITHWHDSTSGGFLRYKQVALKTDSLVVGTPRNYFWPNADGVLALKGDIPSLTNYVTLNGTQTITGEKTFTVPNNFDNVIRFKQNLGSYATGSGYTTMFSNSQPTYYSLGFYDGGAALTQLYFDKTTQSYTFPAASGTIALTSNITTALTNYVPYSGATQNVDLGANNLVSRHLIVNGLSGSYGGSLLLKQNANAGLSNNYTSISSSGLNFVATAVNGAGVLYEATFNLASITTNRSYTLPNASGTIALTSDIPSLSNYVTLDGTQTISGLKTFSNSITNFNNPAVNGVNTLNFKSAAVTDAVISIDTVFTQFQSFGSYGYLFKMKDGTNGLAIRNDGSGFQLNLPFSGSSGVFSSTLTSLSSIKGTNFILSGGTGNTGLYYGHTDRVVLANYTAGGIDFETNGGNINMTLFPNGNLGVGTSLTDDGVNKLQVAGSGKFTGALTAAFGTLNNSASANTTALTLNGYSSTANAHIGQFANGLYLSSNWYYAGAQLNDNTVLGAAAITMQSDATAGASLIQFSLKDAGTGGVSPKMTINSAGSVGIGIASPNYILHAQATSANVAYFNRTTTDGDVLTLAVGGTNAFIFNTTSGARHIQAPGAVDMTMWTNGSEKIRVTNGGNVGVGLQNPSDLMTISATNPYYAVRYTSAGTVGSPVESGIKFKDYAGASGDLRGSITFQDQSFSTSGTNMLLKVMNNSATIITAINIQRDGNVYNYNNSTAWATTSDIRVKENIIEIPSALNIISQLKPVSFDYKDFFANEKKWDINQKNENIGFIAQDFETVFPKYTHKSIQIVNGQQIDDFRTIDTTPLIPYLVKAIQELKAKNDNLELRIIALETKQNNGNH